MKKAIALVSSAAPFSRVLEEEFEVIHMQPETEQAGKAQIKEKARETMKGRLARAKADADRKNRERWEREGRIAPAKKNDMEL